MRPTPRRRVRGQALTELALAMPFLLILLLGSVQVGVIAYGNVTMDTAAREGARIASIRPVNATNFSGPSHTYTGCLSSDTSTNFVVQAVCNNAGILDTSKITVKITKSVDITSLRPDPPVHLAAFHMGQTNCANGFYTFSGTVNGIPSGDTADITTDIDANIDVPVPSSNPTFSFCIDKGNQTVYAKVGAGCTGYTDSYGRTNINGDTSHGFNLTLNGGCPQPIATTTSLTASPTSTTTGQPVTLTSTVTPASGNAPSGTVTFFDGTSVIASASLNGNGTAQTSTSSLTAGNHSISATYNPDVNHTGSTSPVVTVTITSPLSPTSTTLSASSMSVQQGSSVTFTAKVTGSSSTITGTVAFTDTFNGTTTTLGTVALAGGTATLQTSSLAVGNHQVVATYSGDATNANSTSSAVAVAVTSPSGGGDPGPNPFGCTDPPSGLTTMYLQIDVQYPVPIFVPFVGNFFANGNGVHTSTITQVIRINPCSITLGQ